MKKGFTLIELLAVILILGIIALIAIPTVNKIINEARYGAFKSGNDNIMKQVEQDCKTSIMKGENPTLSYLFADGKSSNEINVKGKLPSDGYILLDRNCTITNYYLSDEKNIYSNEEDTRLDYMIKASTNSVSIFKTMYPDYFDNIISVNFIDNLNIPENAIEIKDPSISEKGKIKSWLVPNGEFYDLYVGSEGTIYGNYDSSYLFSDMNIISNIDFSNFETSFVKKLSYFFQKCYQLLQIDVSKFITSNVTTTLGMFMKCNQAIVINLTNWDTSNLINMKYMFTYCNNLKNVIGINNLNVENVTTIHQLFFYAQSLEGIDLSNWNTSNITDMHGVFQNCNSLKYIVGLEKWDISKVKNINLFFNHCELIENIDISTWDLKNISDMTSIFNYCNFTTLKLFDAFSLNQLIEFLPNRTELSTGTIIIVGDKTGINIEALTAKNWNVV